MELIICIMKQTREQQDMVINSLDNFLNGKCIFCGQEHDYEIEIFIESLGEMIEILICEECRKIRE